MKEFKVGKWYEYYNSNQRYALKCKYTESDFTYSEFINITHKTHDTNEAILSLCDIGKEIPLSEIQRYLPDGHVDKIKSADNIKFKVGDSVMILDRYIPINNNRLGEGGRVKHQGPFIIEEIHNNCVKKNVWNKSWFNV